MNKLKYTLAAAAFMPLMALAQANIWVWNNNSYEQYAGVDSVTYTAASPSASQIKPNTDRSQLQPEDKTFTVGEVSFVMKYVEGGTFMMGAQETNAKYSNYDADAGTDCTPHLVHLSSFYMGQTEVTQALWVAVMGRNNYDDYSGNSSDVWKTNYGLGNQYPVYYVTWDKANNFITKLNQLLHESGQLDESLNFALPTEAQWEYAARGGIYQQNTIYAGSNTLDDVAWSNMGHDVAQLQPNELGLYDMSGNVYEWCADWYKPKYYVESYGLTDPTGPSNAESAGCSGSYCETYTRVCRNGSVFYRNPIRARSVKDYRSYHTGFRLCLK